MVLKILDLRNKALLLACAISLNTNLYSGALCRRRATGNMESVDVAVANMLEKGWVVSHVIERDAYSGCDWLCFIECEEERR